MAEFTGSQIADKIIVVKCSRRFPRRSSRPSQGMEERDNVTGIQKRKTKDTWFIRLSNATTRSAVRKQTLDFTNKGNTSQR
mmetsp:Transcript_65322/g.175282  ORF Transcript_65322/g.175282 Transcript_65322/m.175282 type:complete len:81 (+) Transcript_65322:154-396(+)